MNYVSKQTTIITEDWQNIQADIDDIITQHSLLNTLYQKVINQLNNVEITNILKVSKVILNHENPPEASKTLFKRLNEWLQNLTGLKNRTII
ncbi:MAG: hypothetical protein IMF12_05590 [Proteobacteria bacterium]|nr:hypothetical protein [Pseudomonadota bacterium]